MDVDAYSTVPLSGPTYHALHLVARIDRMLPEEIVEGLVAAYLEKRLRTLHEGRSAVASGLVIDLASQREGRSSGRRNLNGRARRGATRRSGYSRADGSVVHRTSSSAMTSRPQLKEGTAVRVIAVAAPEKLDWRWRIINDAGQVLEESHLSYPNSAAAIAQGAKRLKAMNRGTLQTRHPNSAGAAPATE